MLPFLILCSFLLGGRIVMTYGTGELHIRSARTEDGLPKYSCLTLHSLTQERKRSDPAMLTIIGESIFLIPFPNMYFLQFSEIFSPLINHLIPFYPFTNLFQTHKRDESISALFVF